VWGKLIDEDGVGPHGHNSPFAPSIRQIGGSVVNVGCKTISRT